MAVHPAIIVTGNAPCQTAPFPVFSGFRASRSGRQAAPDPVLIDPNGIEVRTIHNQFAGNFQDFYHKI